MKKVMMSLILAMLVTVSSFANDAKATAENLQESKEKITMADVPEVVQNALAESEYEAGNVSEVYKLVLSDILHYEFVIEIDGTKWAIYYDSSGQYAGKKEAEQ